MQRTHFLFATVSAALGSLRVADAADDTFAERLAALERGSGGRLGVFVASDGIVSLAYREHERFPMCSTFKFLLVGAVLQRVDAKSEQLAREIRFGKSDLLSYAPSTSKAVGAGRLSVGELCRAAIELSDNTAANLLLASIGGPPAYTRFARSIGDPVTRLDRKEPSMSESIPGDPRDTTTPGATARDLRNVLLGNALSAPSRARLNRWMANCQTGNDRLRAGLPPSWSIEHKTGTGDHGTANDIALCRRPNGSPVVVTAYLTEATVSSDARDAVLANVGRVAREFVRAKT